MVFSLFFMIPSIESSISFSIASILLLVVVGTCLETYVNYEGMNFFELIWVHNDNLWCSTFPKEGFLACTSFTYQQQLKKASTTKKYTYE